MKSTPPPHSGSPPGPWPPPIGEATSPIGSFTARKRVSSQALLGSHKEIEIEHAGQLYRLRLTALGKLILTK